jgi:hypothetical protein
VRKKQKANFEIPDSAFLGLRTDSTGKERRKLLTLSGSSSGGIIEYY